MQPTWEITQHPLDLARHGLNPYGQPIYRIVWADSRKSRVIHHGKRHDLGRYAHQPEFKGKYILEKWAPPEVIVGMTRSQYDAMLLNFPDAAAEEYPERGEYEFSYLFDGKVDEVFVHKQLDMHEHRLRTMTAADHKIEVEQQEDAKEAAVEAKFEELFHA